MQNKENDQSRRFGLSPNDMVTNHPAWELAREFFAISPQVIAAGKKFIDVDPIRLELRTALQETDAQIYSGNYQDLSMIVNIGDSVRQYQSRTFLIKMVKEFLHDPHNNPHALKMKNRLRTEEKYDEYNMLYNSLELRLNAFMNDPNGMRMYFADWAVLNVDLSQLPRDNFFVQLRETEVIAALQACAVEFQQQKTQELDFLFVDITEYFTQIVQQELTSTSFPEKEHELFTYILLRSFADIGQKNIPKVNRFPEVLKSCYWAAAPIVNLLDVFIQEFPVALTNSDHPGHQQAVDLLTLLNTYPLERENKRNQAVGTTLPGINQFCVGLIIRDFYNRNNYQEFALDMERLSQSGTTNAPWATSFLEYMKNIETETSLHAVFQAKDVALRVFDLERVPQTTIALDQACEKLLQRTNSYFYQFNERQVLSEEHNNPQFFTHGNLELALLRIGQLQAGTYTIAVELLAFYENDSSSDGQTITVTKFRYVVIVNEEVTSVLPVIDRDQLTPEMLNATIEFVKRAVADHLAKIDIAEVEKGREVGDQKSFTSISSKTGKKKIYDRQQRLIAHQEQKQQEESTQNSAEIRLSQRAIQGDKPENLQQVAGASSEALNIFFPTRIDLLPSLQKELMKAKKGREHHYRQIVDSFRNLYNAAEQIKPGKGEQLTRIHGPHGENVWSFRLSYSERCIVVDSGKGDGVGIVVEVGNHEDVYSNLNIENIQKKVNMALGFG